MKKIGIIIPLLTLALASCNAPASTSKTPSDPSTSDISTTSDPSVDAPSSDTSEPYIPSGGSSTSDSGSSSTSAEEVTLTFVTNGGSYVSPLVVEKNTSIEKPSNPTRSGYHFVSWCSDYTLTSDVSWPYTILANTTFYAKWNEKLPIKDYFTTLLASYSVKPSNYIPDTMLPGYSTKTIASASAVDYGNFASNTSVSSIDYAHGYGEQWHMVMDNIKQSDTIFNALSVVSTITSTVTAGFNNYIDSKGDNSANYNTTVGTYGVNISFSNPNLEYTISWTNNAFDTQIYMNMNVSTQVITVRIQLSDSQALKYIIDPRNNSYSFAIRYLGVRRAYFEVKKDKSNVVTGGVYEYIGIDGSFNLSNCAQFTIDDSYVSVVGDKANSLIAFEGYICEVYDATTGLYLGHEVQETLSSIQFDTLWFSLNKITGITSFKMTVGPTSVTDKITCQINGNTSANFTSMNYSVLNPSRRYDIELRKFYYYYKDEKNNYVEAKASIPFLFVQEEKLSTLSTDIYTKNSVSVSLNVSSTILNKIESDYDALVPQYIQDKQDITVAYILSFIGEKHTIA